MKIRILAILFMGLFLTATALAQEDDENAGSSERERFEQMTPDERAAARDEARARWEAMSDEERAAAKEKRRNRRGGKDGHRRDHGADKPQSDTV